MDNGFIFKTIFLLLIATASEAIFFDYPKKALMDFLHSLKEKKEAAVAAKKSHDDVHHYHLHYYPVPVSLVFDEHIKLVHDKQELDHLHRDELKSSGWTDQEYKHVPHPELIIPASHHHEIISDHWPAHNHQSHDPDGLTLQDQIDIAAIKHGIESQHTHHQKHHNVEPRHQTHISLHLPFHQEIILQPPAPAPQKEEKKAHLFSAFFQKLEHIKNSLFNSHEDKKSSSHHCEDKIEKPVTSITSKLRAANAAAYAIYFHPKNLRRF